MIPWYFTGVYRAIPVSRLPSDDHRKTGCSFILGVWLVGRACASEARISIFQVTPLILAYPAPPTIRSEYNCRQNHLVSGIKTPWCTPVSCHFTGISSDFQDRNREFLIAIIFSAWVCGLTVDFRRGESDASTASWSGQASGCRLKSGMGRDRGGGVRRALS